MIFLKKKMYMVHKVKEYTFEASNQFLSSSINLITNLFYCSIAIPEYCEKKEKKWPQIPKTVQKQIFTNGKRFINIIRSDSIIQSNYLNISRSFFSSLHF